MRSKVMRFEVVDEDEWQARLPIPQGPHCKENVARRCSISTKS